ncbi:Txe/YoeB family addiction module toxin [Nitratifractor sp.]
MKILFAEEAWEGYLYWQRHDKKILKRINTLIRAITRDPFDGIGNSGSLKYQWSGYRSRRIDLEHRLVYKIVNDRLLIAQCHYHYRKGWEE